MVLILISKNLLHQLVFIQLTLSCQMIPPSLCGQREVSGACPLLTEKPQTFHLRKCCFSLYLFNVFLPHFLWHFSVNVNLQLAPTVRFHNEIDRSSQFSTKVATFPSMSKDENWIVHSSLGSIYGTVLHVVRCAVIY